jgi:hypothetical protein
MLFLYEICFLCDNNKRDKSSREYHVGDSGIFFSRQRNQRRKKMAGGKGREGKGMYQGHSTWTWFWFSKDWVNKGRDTLKYFKQVVVSSCVIGLAVMKLKYELD